jgi:hypothetical protein
MDAEIGSYQEDGAPERDTPSPATSGTLPGCERRTVAGISAPVGSEMRSPHLAGNGTLKAPCSALVGERSNARE